MEFDNQGCQFDIFMTYVRVHQNFVVVLQSVESDSILTWASSFCVKIKNQLCLGHQFHHMEVKLAISFHLL
jgi:hypothetical protein